MSVKSGQAGGRRAAQKAETRRALLDAAAGCFAKQGWAGTVVADIAQAAGVAHGTFYVHFADKEAIADALLAEFNDALAERLSRALGRTTPNASTLVADRVRAAARAFLVQLDENRPFVTWFADRVASGLDARALTDGINPPVARLLASTLGATTARDDLAIHGLLALWIRVGVRWALGDQRASRRDAEEVLVQMTVGALAGLAKKRSRR
jgi:AcrR family transcriptional regulator